MPQVRVGSKLLFRNPEDLLDGIADVLYRQIAVVDVPDDLVDGAEHLVKLQPGGMELRLFGTHQGGELFGTLLRLAFGAAELFVQGVDFADVADVDKDHWMLPVLDHADAFYGRDRMPPAVSESRLLVAAVAH